MVVEGGNIRDLGVRGNQINMEYLCYRMDSSRFMPWGYAVSFSWLVCYAILCYMLCSQFSLCLLLLLSEFGRALGVSLSFHFQLVFSILRLVCCPFCAFVTGVSLEG